MTPLSTFICLAASRSNQFIQSKLWVYFEDIKMYKILRLTVAIIFGCIVKAIYHLFVVLNHSLIKSLRFQKPLNNPELTLIRHFALLHSTRKTSNIKLT